jgi:small-conductance mechanosensitive channel
MIQEGTGPYADKVSRRYSSLGFKSAIICDVHIKIRIETFAILGAMGLAVGLSLQGSLSNLAGGMLIILLNHSR